MNKKGILISTALLALFSSCKKEQGTLPTETEKTGKVMLDFKNFAGSEVLEIQNGSYTYRNTNGDSFRVSAYKYYLSNIRLIKSDGTEFQVPESYYLIDQSNTASFSRTLSDIPTGNYTTLKVLLGVDSTHNVSGAQAGDLDPLYGMFWTWSTGYIMAKVEGSFKQQSGSPAGMSFHLGGFTGKYSVLREVTLTLPEVLTVAEASQPTIHFKSDILKWFDSPHTINFQSLNQVGSTGDDAVKIADNYLNSLSVIGVEN